MHYIILPLYSGPNSFTKHCTVHTAYQNIRSSIRLICKLPPGRENVRANRDLGAGTHLSRKIGRLVLEWGASKARAIQVQKGEFEAILRWVGKKTSNDMNTSGSGTIKTCFPCPLPLPSPKTLYCPVSTAGSRYNTVAALGDGLLERKRMGNLHRLFMCQSKLGAGRTDRKVRNRNTEIETSEDYSKWSLTRRMAECQTSRNS